MERYTPSNRLLLYQFQLAFKALPFKLEVIEVVLLWSPCFRLIHFGLHGGLVVSVLDCQSWGSGFKPRLVQKFGSRFLFHLRPVANSAMMSTLTTHCQWEDETVRERTGHPPLYAVAKKMKSLVLHTHFCLRASLRDWSSSSSFLVFKWHWGSNLKSVL